MGRELRRKQAKREGKNVKEVQKKVKDKPISPKTFGVIMTVLVLFFSVLYLLTDMFITNKNKWFGKDNEEVVEIENKILAADSLKQTEENYYVYYYNTEEENTEIKNALYSVKDKIYRVDLHDAFNNNFIGEPSGIVGNIEQLKVSDPTLIKVSSESIVEFYAGKDEIVSAFN
jgi:hypothetical protein